MIDAAHARKVIRETAFEPGITAADLAAYQSTIRDQVGVGAHVELVLEAGGVRVRVGDPGQPYAVDELVRHAVPASTAPVVTEW